MGYEERKYEGNLSLMTVGEHVCLSGLLARHGCELIVGKAD